MNLQPVERVPFDGSPEACRIRPFVAVIAVNVLNKKGESTHYLILSTQQELVIPTGCWTATQTMSGNPVDYYAKELCRMFGFDPYAFPNALYYYNITLLRCLAKSLFYPVLSYTLPPSIKLYELIN
jgi:hypothetical protein